MSRAVSRETSNTVTVMLPIGKAPGVVAVGPYKPGKEYPVSREEAERLISAKGFVAVDGYVTDTQDAAVAATTED